MSSEVEILIQLRSQLVSFFDELIESYPSEIEFVVYRIFICDQLPIINVMQYIVDKLVPLEDQVKQKDEKFFLNNNILFDNLGEKGKSKLNHFKNIWLSDITDNEDKEVLWKWFSTFIYLAKAYSSCKEKINN